MTAGPDRDSRPHVMHLLNSFTDGGTERQAIQLANALDAGSEWRVSFAVLDERGPLRDVLAAPLQAALTVVPLRRGWSGAVRAVAELAAAMRRLRVDIIQCHGFYPNVIGLPAGTLAGLPVRVGSKRESVALRTPTRARLERMAFTCATHLVTNCEAVRVELLATGVPEARVRTIHNALLADRIGSAVEGTASSTLPSPPATARHVVMVANFHHRVKDHPTLLRAARIVAGERPDVHFTLAGDGPLRREMQAFAASLGVSSHVQFIGHCDSVSALLEGADVGALSSSSEGFPNVILEYMAAARAVVSTDVGGVREALDDGVSGLLVPPGDEAAMAQAILVLLRDSDLRHRLGRRAREHVLSRFSMTNQVEATEALYRESLWRAAARRP